MVTPALFAPTVRVDPPLESMDDALMMARVLPAAPTLTTLACPPSLLFAPKATELLPVEVAAVPMAMELPPVAAVSMSVLSAPDTVLAELPMAILPPLVLPVVVAAPPKAMSPALVAVLPTPLAVL